MLKALARTKSNKIFTIFFILILLMFPSSLYKHSDKDSTLVVTTIGIDKNFDIYDLTLLAVIPKGSNDVSANLEIFKASGKSISEALDKASNNTGRNVGLAHCDSLIISKSATNENIANILDYFIRTSNLTTNASVIIADNKAEDLIKATKNSNNFLDLSLKNIVLFQEKSSMINKSTVEQFYKTYLSKSGTVFLPILSTQNPTIDNNKEGDGASSNNNSSNTGKSESDKNYNDSQLKIKNDNRVLVLKEGVKDRELTEDEIFIYSLLSPNSQSLKIKITDINDEYVTNSTEVFQQKDKVVFPTYHFKDNKPTIKYHIWLSIMIDEIDSKDNFSYTSINGLQNFLSPIVKEKIYNQINDKLEKTLKLMKDNKDDILNIYEKFNAFRNKEWKKYIKNKTDLYSYIDDLNIDLNLKLNYII